MNKQVPAPAPVSLLFSGFSSSSAGGFPFRRLAFSGRCYFGTDGIAIHLVMYTSQRHAKFDTTACSLLVFATVPVVSISTSVFISCRFFFFCSFFGDYYHLVLCFPFSPPVASICGVFVCTILSTHQLRPAPAADGPRVNTRNLPQTGIYSACVMEYYQHAIYNK